jgi:class 3 adenylate cyclase
MEGRMIQRKSLNDPDGSIAFPGGEGTHVRVGAMAVGRAILQPGWRWSKDVQPNVGTASCEVHHVHIVLRGSFAARMDGGEEVVFVAGDVCDIPPGHDAWVVGDEVAEILELAGNPAEFGTPGLHTGTVVTMLMTDIVGSTDLAERMGDPAWRQVLERHNRIVRSQFDRFRGTEIATTGDGFLATFSSALGALHAARAISAEVRTSGVEVRIGVHTGEVEATHGDVQGLAVHAVSRIMAIGGASEVVVSDVTRALSGGGRFAFDPLGEHRLKGIAAPLELFRLL